MAKDFRKLMKDRRIELGMTQVQVGESLGHDSHVTVQRWEAGTRPVKVEDVGAWADVLKIPRGVALAAWVSSESGEEITYVADEEEQMLLSSYRGFISPTGKKYARDIIEAMRRSDHEESLGGSSAIEHSETEE